MGKNHFYVVWRGRKTGVFDNWAETEEAVSGFSGAKFKGFNRKEDAESAFEQPYWHFMKRDPQDTPAHDKTKQRQNRKKRYKKHGLPPWKAYEHD